MSQIRILFKGNQLKIVPLTDTETVMGSAEDCAIFIDSLAIQPYHALILKQGDTARVRVIEAEFPIVVNGEEFIERELQDGEIFHIGKHSFQYESGNRDAREPDDVVEPIFKKDTQKTRAAWLQILNGPNLGKTINLHRQMTSIGKKGAQHEMIVHRSDGFFLTHLEGREIPRVNGDEIGDEAFQLNDGDTIAIGKIKLLFSMA